MNQTQVSDRSLMRPSGIYQNLMLDAPEIQNAYYNTPKLTSIICSLCLSSFYFGYSLVNFSTFSQAIVDEVLGSIATSTAFTSVLKGIVPVGAIIGAAICPLLMRCFSRKHFLLLINLCALVIEGVIQVTNVYAFLVCRALQGIFIGNYMGMVPIYINQLAPKQIVGSFGVFTQLFVVIGIVFSYILGLIFSSVNLAPYTFYRIMTLINAVFIILQMGLLFWNYIPQSPNSLIAKNRLDEARAVIGMFTVEKFVQITMREKQQQVQVELGVVSKQNQQPIRYSRVAYLVACLLPSMQQLNGVNAIVTSAQTIVQTVLPSIAYLVPLILNVVQLVATFITIFILKCVGRKPLLLIGNLAIAIIDLLVGVLFIFSDWQHSGIIVFVMLILFNVFYGLTLGPIVWLYVPQIVPAKVVPFITLLNWLFCSVCVIATPIAISANNNNGDGVFFFFGGISLVFFIILACLLVQTKNKSAKQIANLYHINKE